MYSDDKLAEIRERVSITDLISEYVQLKKTGKNYRGLCPFHQERTPSFFVNAERESFHCFGCGAGGNLFHFLMKIEGLSFPEAVERLAERAGVEVGPSAPKDPEAANRRKRSFEIHRHAAWYYHCLLKKLPREAEIWTYLASRQIPEEMCEHFYLGFCPPQDSGLQNYLKKKGFSAQEIQENQLYKGSREFFRGRLLFPIFKNNGKVVGFGGRKVREEDFGPKYLNSPESVLFKKGELFYGLNLAKEAVRRKNQVLVVEGYLDVITLHHHGFTQAIAPLGTSLTLQQARYLQRFCEEVILLFDGDTAGQQASLRALEALLTQGNCPKIISLPPGEDPDSFLKRYGKLAFEKKLESRRNLLEELIDKGSASLGVGPSGLDQKGKIARRILAVIEKIPDRIVQNLYRRRLAEAMEIPEEWFLGKPNQKPRATFAAPQRLPRPSWLPEEETILEIWLKFPTLRSKIVEGLEVDDFCTKEVREFAHCFWDPPAVEADGKTGKYFDLAPPGLLEVLSELSVRTNGLEEEEIAVVNLRQAILRLKEKRLKQDLKALKKTTAPEQIVLIKSKIEALSRVIKNKERIYGEK